MNNTFNWSRFGKVVAKDARSIWANMGTTILIITLLPTVVWLLWLALGSATNGSEMPLITPLARWMMIGCCIAFVSIMTPSRMYRTCNLRNEGLYYAMLPASKLEKYLSMILFTVIVCPLLCLVGSLVVDTILTLLPIGHYHEYLWQGTALSDYWQLFEIDEAGDTSTVHEVKKLLAPGYLILCLLLAYLEYASIFLFTNTIFKKHKVLLTILCLWGISFVLEIIMLPIIGTVMANVVLPQVSSFQPVVAIGSVRWAGILIPALICALFFWWTGYRLKKMAY